MLWYPGEKKEGRKQEEEFHFSLIFFFSLSFQISNSESVEKHTAAAHCVFFPHTGWSSLGNA